MSGFERAYFDYAADATVASRLSGTPGLGATAGVYYTPNDGTAEVVADVVTARLVEVTEDLDVTGAVDIIGTLTASESILQGEQSAGGTITLSLDGNSNPNLEIVAAEAGDGQAYLDLITNKVTTSTNLHRLRHIMGNTGDYTVEHLVSAPGPNTVLQQMVWNAAGTEMEFAFGGAAGLFIKEAGLIAPSYVTLAAQNPNIAVDAITTIFTIPATALAIGKAVQIPVNLYIFDDANAQFYFVTLIVNAARSGANIYAYAENQAAADSALLSQTGNAWNLLLTGSGSATLSIQIETTALPAPSGLGWLVNYNATFLGAQ